MLMRQRTILDLLTRIERPVTRTVLVKLIFLLRHETALRHSPSFYDFVPYKYGPFSFTLYRELELLSQDGYVTVDDDGTLSGPRRDSEPRKPGGLTSSVISAVVGIVSRYGEMASSDLIQSVYKRYAWYAINSELPERKLVSLQRPAAVPAIYTAGYEGKSVEAFLNDLLVRGMAALVDVRANPISRKYGFSKLRLEQLCERLGLIYRHLPSLGISGTARASARSRTSHNRLLRRYERSMLPPQSAEVEKLGILMTGKPCVLMCVEGRPEDCHRGRLAQALAVKTGLEVVHL